MIFLKDVRSEKAHGHDCFNKLFLLLLINVLLLNLFSLAADSCDYIAVDNYSSPPSSSSLHAPILIEGDAELDAFCDGNGTDGTEENPHVISDYEFSGPGSDWQDGIISAIDIRGVALHLRIISCEINSYYRGINITDCSNITIESCSINDTYTALKLDDSDHNIIYNNIVNNSGNIGIHLDHSVNNTIDNNFIYHSVQGSGMYIYYSEENNVSHNYITGLGYSFNQNGILLSSSSYENLIFNNTVIEGGTGIQVFYADFNIIKNNTFTDNLHGIYLPADATDNEIYYNLFIDNDLNAKSDSGPNIWNHNSIGNFYSDYQEQNPDASHNGQVWEEPYTISGSGGEVDEYPMYLAAYEDHDPIANFTYTISESDSKTVSFTFTGELGDEPSEFDWNFGEDSASDSFEMNPEYTYTNPGEYTVTLTITDSDGDVNSTSQTIVIEDNPPGVPGFSSVIIIFIAGASTITIIYLKKREIQTVK